MSSTLCNCYKGERSFQKLERGEETADSDDSTFWKVGGDVRDDISMLPRKIALKVGVWRKRQRYQHACMFWVYVCVVCVYACMHACALHMGGLVGGQASVRGFARE